MQDIFPTEFFDSSIPIILPKKNPTVSISDFNQHKSEIKKDEQSIQSSEKLQCMICFEDIINEEPIKVKCGHCIHRSCAKESGKLCYQCNLG